MIPYQEEGGAYVALRDPIAVSSRTLLMPYAAAPLLGLLDGEHTVAEIRAEFRILAGATLSAERIEGLVRQLDEALFMEGERFAEALERALRCFRRLRVRPAAHAGTAYHGDPEHLRGFLDSLFRLDGGPSPIGDYCEKGGRDRICAALAPHIDPGRGATAYAATYKAIAEGTDADLFVVLGVAHQMTENIFAPCDMGFDTPFGVAPADHDFMSALNDRCPVEPGPDLLVHRTEHSIEFQAVFLQYLYAKRREVTIAPILCSSLLRAVGPGEDPMDKPEVADFIDALRETIGDCGRKVCVIGGVDLAHVGPKFGHEYEADETRLARVSREDMSLLDRVAEADAEGFFALIARDNDARNVCGFPAIYTLLKVCGACEGELLDYGQAREPEVKSAVTFASMVFREGGGGRR